MSKFTLDREKAKRLAEELGLEVAFDCPTSGVLIKKQDEELTIDFVKFFPEMSLLDSNVTETNKFVTKEEGTLDIFVEDGKMLIKQRRETKVVAVATFIKPGKLFLAS